MAAPTIAVIGLGNVTIVSRSNKTADLTRHAGAAGLVTVKNLIEEGFAVTGFERNSYVGGLWKYTEGPTTSVLECTKCTHTASHGSKDCLCQPQSQIYLRRGDVSRIFHSQRAGSHLISYGSRH